MVTDGELSFVLLYYCNIQWGLRGTFSGFISGNINFLIPEIGTPVTGNIKTSSNVGVPGLYIYRVDQEGIILPSYKSTGRY